MTVPTRAELELEHDVETLERLRVLLTTRSPRLDALLKRTDVPVPPSDTPLDDWIAAGRPCYDAGAGPGSRLLSGPAQGALRNQHRA